MLNESRRAGFANPVGYQQLGQILPLHEVFAAKGLSVIIVTWLVMPVTTRLLNFWLDQDSSSNGTTLLGGMLLHGVWIAMLSWLVMELRRQGCPIPRS